MQYFLAEFFREIIRNIIEMDSVVLIIALMVFLVLVCCKLFKTRKTYYCVRQHDITDCGPAFLAAVFF